MTELSRLKEWRTVAEAARYLTAKLKATDELSEADVLQLALEGRINLSVRFMNDTMVRPGKCVGIDDMSLEESQRLGKRPAGTGKTDEGNQNVSKMALLESVQIDCDRLFAPEPVIGYVSGIWDLLMVGNGRQDVEGKYQSLTGGPSISTEGGIGVFVEKPQGPVCQLMGSHSHSDVAPPILDAALQGKKEHMIRHGAEEEQLLALVKDYKERRDASLQSRYLKHITRKWDIYPLKHLPEESVFVISSKALREFETALGAQEEGQSTKPALGDKERTSLLKMVYGMAIARYGYIPGAPQNDATGTGKDSIQADLQKCGLDLNVDTVRKYIREAEDRFADPRKQTGNFY